MDFDWTHAGPTILAAFLASLVEFLEALTVVLAVGAVRGWRGALGGTGLALLMLSAIVAAFGPALTRIPLVLVQLGVGTLLLLFGMRWLRKAILRSAGVIPLHDEAEAYAKQTAALEGQGGTARWDGLGLSVAFKITMVEGVEVVFIVIAMGAGGAGLLAPASVGAVAALALVVALGLVLHRPVAMIPENTLKFVVGVLLCSFGTFWSGEGMGLTWPGEDLSIPELNAGFLAAAVMAVSLCRRHAARGRLPLRREDTAMTPLKRIWSEFIGLFVDDGSLAIAVLAWLAAAWLLLPRMPLPPAMPPAILFAGIASILTESTLRRARLEA